MRKILVISSLLIILIFVVSCVPQMTDEEIEAELQKLTPEERESLLRDLELEKGTFAGQAISRYTGSFSKLSKLPKARVQSVVKKLVAVCTPKTSAQLCILDQTCGDIPDGCGGVISCGNLCGDLKAPYCIDNKCRPELWCEDTDGGFEKYKLGTTTNIYNHYYDRCFLLDVAVGVEAPSIKYVNNCNDITIGSSLEGGIVTHVGDCMLIEYFCTNPKPLINGSVAKCPYGCSNGACLNPPVQATTGETPQITSPPKYQVVQN